MTSFVSDRLKEGETLERLYRDAQAGRIENLQIESMFNGDEELTLCTVSFDMVGDYMPQYDPYTPLEIQYTPSIVELEDELQQFTILAIEVLKQVTLSPVSSLSTIKYDDYYIITVYMSGAQPLYIKSSDVEIYQSAIEEIQDMRFISSDPLVSLIKSDIPISKHSMCDVYMFGYEDYQPILDELVSLQSQYYLAIPTGVYGEVPTEISRMYGYEFINSNRNYTYYRGNETFDSHFFNAALESILTYNTVPLAKITIPTLLDNKVGIEQYIAMFTYIYILLLNEGDAKIYNSPATINQVQFFVEDDSITIYFPCHTLNFYDEVSQRFQDEYSSQQIYLCTAITSPEDGIRLRYSYSLQGVKSFIIQYEGQEYVVVKSQNLVDFAPEDEVKSRLIELYSDALKEERDPISMETLDEMTLEELVELIITTSGTPIKYENLTSMERMMDPINRKALTNDQMSKLGFHRYGYYTLGPLLGLIDNPQYNLYVREQNSIVLISQIDPYYTSQEIQRSIEEDDEPIQSNDYETVTFSATQGDESIDFCVLTLPVMGKYNREEVRDKLQRMMNLGEFYTTWSKVYTSVMHLPASSDLLSQINPDYVESPVNAENFLEYMFSKL
jgi:hypothetical protein